VARPQITDIEIVQQLAGKNPAGMEALYDRYAGRIYGVISHIVGDEATAEEAFAETCTNIWHRFDRYDSGRQRLSGWILDMARTTALERIRNGSVRLAPGIDDSPAGIPPPAAYNPETEPLRAVAGIDASHRDILEQFYFRGNNQIEVALKLHIPLGTVRARLREAVRALRGALQQPEH
jgi:RNA polymerase sigma factor (sigma-70 family)